MFLRLKIRTGLEFKGTEIKTQEWQKCRGMMGKTRRGQESTEQVSEDNSGGYMSRINEGRYN